MDGRFTFALDTLPSANIAVEARYSGDAGYWPAFAALMLEP